MPSPTLPGSTPTQTNSNPGSTESSGASHTVSSTGTSTGSQGSGTGTATDSVHPTNTQGVPPPPSPENAAKKTTAIAVGTAFGVLALIAGSIATAYYVKHHRPETGGASRFHLLGGEGSDEGGNDSVHMAGVIPTAGGPQREKSRHGPSAWFGHKESSQLGAGLVLHDNGRQRRDMFADEDREFGLGSVYRVGRDGSGGSSWSLRSVGAAIGSVGLGVRGILSRQNSEDARNVLREPSDPFSDNTYSRDDLDPYGVALIRPQGRRQTSYTSQISYASTNRSYHDPFAEHPIDEVISDKHGSSEDIDAEDSTLLGKGSVTTLPPTLVLQTLAPLTEQSSLTSDPTSLRSSQNFSPSSPFESIPSSSYTSHEYRPQRRSMIDSSPVPSAPLRRSDSWWAKFSRTSFLERRSSGSQSPRAMDFRDPNPAPRLVPIQEASSHSNSPDSPEKSKRDNRGHRHSLSSLQTAGTADSEAIERMGGMDVIQRVGTNTSHQTTPSTGRDTPEPERSWVPRPLSVVASSGRSEGSQSLLHADDERSVESPVEMVPSEQSHSSSDSSTPPAAPSTPQRPAPVSGQGGVMSRIQAYERRTSATVEEASGPQSPTSPGGRNTRKREENPSKSRVTINYGLVPRASLFVANPDHRGSPSSDS